MTEQEKNIEYLLMLLKNKEIITINDEESIEYERNAFTKDPEKAIFSRHFIHIEAIRKAKND